MKVRKAFISFLLMVMMVFSCLNVHAEAPTVGKYYENNTDYVQKIFNNSITDRTGNNIGHIEAFIAKLKVNDEDKGYLYNIEPNKDRPAVNSDLTREEINDLGYRYILKNGFPSKRPYDGTDKENYYVTQIAIWMYAYVVHGIKDGTVIANTLVDSNGNLLDNYNKNLETEALVEAAYNLFSGARKAHDDNIAPPTSVDLTLSAPNNDLVQNGQYLLSPEITVNLEGATSYKVTVVGGGYVVDVNNNKKSTFNANEKFKVASNGLKDTNLKATVTATISDETIYKYVPTGGKGALLYTGVDGEEKSVQKDISFIFQANRVSISLLDSETKNNLSGATLVLKDSNGNNIVLTEDNNDKTNPWITTEEPYELVLNPGEYVLEEVKAPTNYALNKNTVRFKVKADGTVDQVPVMENTKLIGVNINKYEATGEENLAGATLEIHDKDGNLVDSWVSETMPHYVILNPGQYKLTEKDPPEGYLKTDSVIEFTVLEDGSTKTPVFIRNELIPVPITGSNRSLIIGAISLSLIIVGTVMLLKNIKIKKEI